MFTNIYVTMDINLKANAKAKTGEKTEKIERAEIAERKKKINLKEKCIDFRKLPTFLWDRKKLSHKLNVEKRLNKSNDQENLLNNIRPQKHFVPSIKEWNQSIYAYNKETVKNLPCLDQAAFKLIFSYLNFYDFKKEELVQYRGRRRRRINYVRSCFREVMPSKLNFKHTNKNVTIIVHVLNRRIRYYLQNVNLASTINALNKQQYKLFMQEVKPKMLILKNHIKTLNDINNIKDIIYNFDNYKQIFNNKQTLKTFCLNNKIINNIFNGSQLKQTYNSEADLQRLFTDKEKLEKIFNVYINYIDAQNRVMSEHNKHNQHNQHNAHNRYDQHNKYNENNENSQYNELSVYKNLNQAIKEFISLEIQSVISKQLYFLEKSKFNKSYLLPLINLLELIYKKEIKFNFINLRYIGNSASIISDDIKKKIKVKTSVGFLMKTLLNSTHFLPRKTLLNTTAKRRYVQQNIELKDMYKHIKHNSIAYGELKKFFKAKRSGLALYSFQDTPSENFFNKSGFADTNFTDNDPLEKLINSDNKPISKPNVNKTLTGLKYKFLTGLHFLVRGRISKRYSAVRSRVFKKYKGSLRDHESSVKRLSTSVVRGLENSSVQYSLSTGVRRAGSYGVKVWSNAN